MAIGLTIVVLTSLHAQKPLAPTPPMGWNSWNFFGADVTERGLRQVADILVSSGMRDAGYVYVNIDDGWQGRRDANGVLHPNEKFPDMKGLADYIHSKGLKFGIYSSPGPTSCGGFEGSYGHEDQDAQLFASWGADLVKYDECSLGPFNRKAAPSDIAKQDELRREAYEKMHQEILKTGRPMIYSFCEFGNATKVWDWGPAAGATMWRTSDDIKPDYYRIMTIAAQQEGLGQFSGPDHWNDPDMLEVGNGRLTFEENVTHMTMWAMLAAPLIAGNDLGSMTPEIKSILLNREVIAIDQDASGKPGTRLLTKGSIQIWGKKLSDGTYALAVFNLATLRTDTQGIKLPLAAAGMRGMIHARDVWKGQEMGAITENTVLEVPRHGVVLLKLRR